MFQTWMKWLQDRIVVLLVATVLVLSGVVLWLVFSPDEDDIEWRTVNAEMEQMLAEQERVQKQELTPDAGETADDAKRASSASPKPSEGRIDLNRATLADLESLPGIGPSKAQAILDLRTRLGRFSTVEQLLDVKGIGPKTLDKFRERVTVTLE